MSDAPRPVVGREPILAALRRVVRGALNGRGGLLLLSGEAGIGKTLLAAEAAAYARDRGAAVAWASCSGEGAPGFWPWMQIFRSLGDPGILERLTADHKEPTAGPGPTESRRLLLFDELTASLLSMASRKPLVLVLDDLQWADRDSLALLAFTARRLRHAPILVLGAYRDMEVGEWARSHLAEASTQASTIPLAGLTSADVALLMESILGHAPPAAVCTRISERTGGNPFFVQELTRLLQSHSDIAIRFDAVPPAIPAGVREVVERRLARLSEDCMRVLRTASVLGATIDPDLLAHLGGIAPDELVRRLGEAADAGVLMRAQGLPAPFHFVHDLFMETLYEGLGPAVRSHLHLRVGDALEDRRRAGADVALAVIAHHYLLAASGGAAPKVQALDHLLAAAHDAEARLAFEEAAGHYETVLGLLEAGPRAAVPRAELVLRLAEAQRRSGQARPARASFMRAAELARRASDSSALALAALGVQSIGADRWAPADDEPALLAEALEARGDQRDALTARLLAATARQTAWSGAGTGPAAETQANQAVQLAREAGDRQTLGLCLLAQHNAVWRPGTATQRLALTDEIVTLAGESDEDLALQGRQLRAMALLELADPRAGTELSEYVQRARRSRQPRLRWLGACGHAFQALLTGDLALASRLVAEAGELGRQIGEPDWWNVLCTQTWEVRRAQGRAGELVRELERERSTPGFLDQWLAPVEVLALHEEGEGRGGARPRISFTPDPQTPGWAWFLPRIYLAEVASALGMADESRQLYHELLPHGDACVVEGGLVRFPGSVQLYLGLLARGFGEVDAAVEHLERALRVHERLAARTLAARTGCELAVSLLLAARGAHSERAVLLLQAAVEEADACGATALARRAAEQLEACRRLSPGSGRAAGFRRDGDVWELAFDGRTVRLKDSRGLSDIAALLAAAGRPVKATDLVAASGAGALARRVGLGDDPVLDERARREYRGRLEELSLEIDEAERDHDLERRARSLAERQALVDQLAAATGLGGRPRRLGSDSERARKAVTARIQDSLGRIERAHPGLGRHLRESIRTGGSCAYLPTEPVDWQLG